MVHIVFLCLLATTSKVYGLGTTNGDTHTYSIVFDVYNRGSEKVQITEVAPYLSTTYNTLIGDILLYTKNGTWYPAYGGLTQSDWTAIGRKSVFDAYGSSVSHGGYSVPITLDIDVILEPGQTQAFYITAPFFYIQSMDTATSAYFYMTPSDVWLSDSFLNLYWGANVAAHPGWGESIGNVWDGFNGILEYDVLYPTVSPTAEPSHEPTTATNNPTTRNPTIAPSNAPTSNTNPPTFYTMEPTAAPTSAPSDSPTSYTNTPTASPTSAPSDSPTNPSIAPSPAPTSATNTPTTNPIISGHWSVWVSGSSTVTGTTLLETSDNSQITEFCIRSGVLVDALKVRWRNGEWSEQVGGSGGVQYCESLDADLCWTQIYVYRNSDQITGLTFCRYDADARNNRICGELYGGTGTRSVKFVEYYPTGECIKALNVTHDDDYLIGIQAYFETWTPQQPTPAPTNDPSVSGPTPPPTYNPVAAGRWSPYVSVDTTNMGISYASMLADDDSQITEICVQHGTTYMNGITVRWRNGEWSALKGTSGDSESCHALASINDCYDAISIWNNEAMNSIQLRIRSNGSWTTNYGGSGGSASVFKTIMAEDEDECIKGLRLGWNSVALREMKVYFEGWTPLITTATPTMPSVAPSVAPTTTPTDSSSPSKAPSQEPSSPSKAPSQAPSSLETSPPSKTPSSQPTTSEPTTLEPTVAPWSDLYLAIRYTDKSWAEWYSFKLAETSDYTDIMQNALDAAFQLIYGPSIMYSVDDSWEDLGKEWSRAGIINVDFCRFSDVILNDDCASDDDEANDEEEYVAIAVFDAVANAGLDEYVQYLKEAVRDDTFLAAFGEQMNDLLDESTRRRNLLANNFEVLSIEVSESVNEIFSNTDSVSKDDSSDGENAFIKGDGSMTTVSYVVIAAGVLVIVLLIVGCVFYCKRRSKKRGKPVFADDVEFASSPDDDKNARPDTVGTLFDGGQTKKQGIVNDESD